VVNIAQTEALVPHQFRIRNDLSEAEVDGCANASAHVYRQG